MRTATEPQEKNNSFLLLSSSLIQLINHLQICRIQCLYSSRTRACRTGSDPKILIPGAGHSSVPVSKPSPGYPYLFNTLNNIRTTLFSIQT